jgi:hypothetical protein
MHKQITREETDEMKDDTYVMEPALFLPVDSLLIPNRATRFPRITEVEFKLHSDSTTRDH